MVSSKRNLDRGFESKLVSQLPLIGHIKRRVAFDYLFTVDGDISFAKAPGPEPPNPNPNPDPDPNPNPDPLTLHPSHLDPRTLTLTLTLP